MNGSPGVLAKAVYLRNARRERQMRGSRARNLRPKNELTTKPLANRQSTSRNDDGSMRPRARASERSRDSDTRAIPSLDRHDLTRVSERPKDSDKAESREFRKTRPLHKSIGTLKRFRPHWPRKNRVKNVARLTRVAERLKDSDACFDEDADAVLVLTRAAERLKDSDFAMSKTLIKRTPPIG
jgi:hypothetical protein